MATSACIVAASVDGPHVHPPAEASGGLEERRVDQADLTVVERHVEDLKPTIVRGFGART
jgi:hypothetical protein